MRNFAGFFGGFVFLPFPEQCLDAFLSFMVSQICGRVGIGVQDSEREESEVSSLKSGQVWLARVRPNGVRAFS